MQRPGAVAARPRSPITVEGDTISGSSLTAVRSGCGRRRRRTPRAASSRASDRAVEPGVEQDPRLVEPAGPQQRGDPGLLDDLALGVGAAQPRRSGCRARPAGRRPPSSRPRRHAAQRPSERRDHLAVGRVLVARRPSASRPRRARPRRRAPAAATAACSARNGVAGRPAASRPASRRRRRAGRGHVRRRPGVSAQRKSSEPVSTRARQPRRAARAAAASRSDGVRRRGRRATARAAPRARRSGSGCRSPAPVAGDPVVHPGQAGLVVAGLVVRVRPGVRGVPGASAPRASERQERSIASSKRPCSWRTNASRPVNHQSSPYAGIARSTIAPGLAGHLGDAGEGDRRHRGREQHGVARVGRRGADAAGASRRAGGRRRRARGCARARSRAAACVQRRRAAGRRRRRRRTSRGRAARASRGRARRSGRARARRRPPARAPRAQAGAGRRPRGCTRRRPSGELVSS